MEWVEKQKNTSRSDGGQSQETILEERRSYLQQEALVFFKRKQAFDVLGVERSNKIQLKKHLSESPVRK